MKASWLDGAMLAMGVIRDGVFVYVNQAFVDLAAMPREALVGQPFLGSVAPEDRDRMRDRYMRRVRGEQVPGTYEFTFLRGDGERRVVETWVSLDDDGDVVFQLNDRTDRAARQEKLAGLARLGAAVQLERAEPRIFAALARGLIDLEVGMARLAPDRAGSSMRVVSASAPGGQVARFETKIGRRVAGLYGSLGPSGEIAWREGSAYLDDLPLSVSRFFSRDPITADMARAHTYTRGVLLRVDLDGRARDLLLLMADWFLPDHLPACRLFASQVSAALDLAKAQQRLVERERLAAIGELSAVVAHEVRNPLGVLFNSLGSIRKLLGASAQGSVGTLLGIMEEETDRLNHIVGDLLDFARPTTPSLAAERVDQLVEEAVVAALGDARTRIKVQREIRELPPVPLDARLMRQAMRNLVDNAVQAMPDGGTITIRIAPDEVARVKLARIDVEDTGLGMPPDVESRIFEPFFTTRASGTGLGLALVKRIVESHDGKIRVRSVEGRGTTFSIWLPLEEEAVRSGLIDIDPPSRL